jgi:hypothetical protein
MIRSIKSAERTLRLLGLFSRRKQPLPGPIGGAESEAVLDFSVLNILMCYLY